MPSEYGTYDLESLSAHHADAALTPTAYDAGAADLFIFTARNAMLVGGFGLEVTTAYQNGGTDQIASLGLPAHPQFRHGPAGEGHPDHEQCCCG